MAVGDLAQDRGELLRRRRVVIDANPEPSSLKRAQERVDRLERVLAKFGDEATSASPAALAEARSALAKLKGSAGPPVVAAAEAAPEPVIVVAEPETPAVLDPNVGGLHTLVWLERPVLLGEHSRTKVLGYDALIGAPAWLEQHLAAKAAG